MYTCSIVQNRKMWIHIFETQCFYLCSPLQKRPNVFSLQTFQITFEYGPPQLNLFRYVTKKASTLWKEAKEKCILKDEGEPIEIFHLICEQDDSNVETCLKRFGFDDYQLDKMC